MAERFKAAVLKTAVVNSYRGFESYFTRSLLKSRISFSKIYNKSLFFKSNLYLKNIIFLLFEFALSDIYRNFFKTI